MVWWMECGRRRRTDGGRSRHIFDPWNGGNYSTDSNVEHMALISNANFKLLAGRPEIWRENPCHLHLPRTKQARPSVVSSYHRKQYYSPLPAPPLHHSQPVNSIHPPATSNYYLSSGVQCRRILLAVIAHYFWLIQPKVMSSSASGDVAIVTIKVLFFASAREAAGGINSTTLELDSDDANSKALRWVWIMKTCATWACHDFRLSLVLNRSVHPFSTPFNHQWKRTKLANIYPKLAPFVEDEENITLALNEEYIPMGEIKNLKEGDTVALIPPISGGWAWLSYFTIIIIGVMIWIDWWSDHNQTTHYFCVMSSTVLLVTLYSCLL